MWSFVFLYKFNTLIAYLVCWKVRGKCAIRNLVVYKSKFKSQASSPPLLVLSIVYVRHQVFQVHIVVPVNHIFAHIVLLLVVVAKTLVPALFHVEFMNTVVAADDLLQLISLLKAETVKPNQGPEHRRAAIVLRYQLNQFVKYALQISVGL
jgi:hypothetical protein